MSVPSQMLHVEYFEIKVRDLMWYRFTDLHDNCSTSSHQWLDLLTKVFTTIHEETMAIAKKDTSYGFRSLKEDVFSEIGRVWTIRTKRNINILHILVYLVGNYMDRELKRLHPRYLTMLI